MDQSQVDKLTQVELEGGANKVIPLYVWIEATINVAPNSLIEAILIVNI